MSGTWGGIIHKHAYWIAALLCLFIFRIVAQLLQATFPTGLLPPFSQWQGSGLPYPVLLISQLLIVLIVVSVIRRIMAGRLRPDVRIGRRLLALGGLYFTVMSLRLVLGLTLLSSVPWFAKPLPAFFHMVLASIVLLIGNYHYQDSRGVRSQ